MRRAFSITIVLVLLLSGFSLTTIFDFTSQNAAAGVKVDSDITGTVQWQSGGSPYWVTSNIDISGTLKIDVGVVVNITAGVTITVVDGGKIYANGSKGNEIIFSFNVSTEADSIIIQNTGIAKFDWCKFQNLTTAIKLQSNVYNVDITNCSFDSTCADYFELTGSSKVNVTSTKFAGAAFENDVTGNLGKMFLDSGSELYIKYFTNVWTCNLSSSFGQGTWNPVPYPGVDVSLQDNNSILQGAGKTDSIGAFMYTALTAVKISGPSKSLDYSTYNPHTITVEDKWFKDPVKKNKGGVSSNSTTINVSYVAKNMIANFTVHIDSDLHIDVYFIFDYSPVIITIPPSKVSVTEDKSSFLKLEIIDNDDLIEANLTFNVTDQLGRGIYNDTGSPNTEDKWIYYNFVQEGLYFYRTIESPFSKAPPNDYAQKVPETITVNITDYRGQRDTISFQVEFQNVPDKPVLSDIATTYTVKEDVAISFQINVSDDDNLTEQVYVTSDTEGVSYNYVDPTHQYLVLNLPNEFAGNDEIKEITINATDNCSYKGDKNVVSSKFTVQFKQTPDAPLINGTIPDMIGTESDWIPELVLSDYWYDPDPDDDYSTVKWYVTGENEKYFFVSGENSTANNPLSIEWVYTGDLGGAQDTPAPIIDDVRIWLHDKYGLTIYQDIQLIVSPTNEQPSLHKVNIEGSKVTVDPDYGSNQDWFSFMIEYKDLDGAKGDAPEYVEVWIDGINHTMYQVDPQDDDYSDGKRYYRDLKLLPGVHEHYFTCSDSAISTRLPTNDSDPIAFPGPTVVTQILVKTEISDDGYIEAEIGYSGSGAAGYANLLNPAKPSGSNVADYGEINISFQVDTTEMLTIEWVDFTIDFGTGFSNYGSIWLRKSDMKVAYLSNGQWTSLVYSDMKEKDHKLTCNISNEFTEYQPILASMLTNDNPYFTVTGKLDADADDVLNNKDAFPFDPAASDDSDSDGSPNRWNPGYDQSDSTSKPELYIDDFPDDPAASLDTDGDGCPDDWNLGKTQADSTSDPRLDLDNWLDDPGVCADTDGDGKPNRIDRGKVIGDFVEDTDDDNDGMPDHWEINQTENAIRKGYEWRLDPKDSSDGALDWDDDGRNNTQEYQDETNPFVADSKKDKDDGALSGSNMTIIIIIIIIVIIILVLLMLLTKKRKKEEPTPPPGAEGVMAPPPGPEPGQPDFPPGEPGPEGVPPPPPPGFEGEGEAPYGEEFPTPPPDGVEGVEGEGGAMLEPTTDQLETTPEQPMLPEATPPGAEQPEPEVEPDMGVVGGPEGIPEEMPVTEAPMPVGGEGAELPASEPGPEGAAAPETMQFSCPVCGTAVTREMPACPGCQSPLSFD